MLDGCGDVKKNQLVNFFIIENLDGIDRVSDVFRILELDGLD